MCDTLPRIPYGSQESQFYFLYVKCDMGVDFNISPVFAWSNQKKTEHIGEENEENEPAIPCYMSNVTYSELWTYVHLWSEHFRDNIMNSYIPVMILSGKQSRVLRTVTTVV